MNDVVNLKGLSLRTHEEKGRPHQESSIQDQGFDSTLQNED